MITLLHITSWYDVVNVDPDISRRSPVRSRVKTPCDVQCMCPFYGRQCIIPGVRLHDYLPTSGASLQAMLCQLRIMHLDNTDALFQGYNWESPSRLIEMGSLLVLLLLQSTWELWTSITQPRGNRCFCFELNGFVFSVFNGPKPIWWNFDSRM